MEDHWFNSHLAHSEVKVGKGTEPHIAPAAWHQCPALVWEWDCDCKKSGKRFIKVQVLY